MSTNQQTVDFEVLIDCGETEEDSSGHSEEEPINDTV